MRPPKRHCQTKLMQAKAHHEAHNSPVASKKQKTLEAGESPKNDVESGPAGMVPEAPVFYPTPAEWNRPMEYIKHLQRVAGYAGICKIIPPKGWRPPFAAEKRGFRFKTRVQNLGMVEGRSRIEKYFVQALRLFLFNRGTPMDLDKLPVFLEASSDEPKVVEFYRLYRIVRELGGYDKVCKDQNWNDIINTLGLKADEMYRIGTYSSPSRSSVSASSVVDSENKVQGKQAASQLLLLYRNTILEFIRTGFDAAAPPKTSSSPTESQGDPNVHQRENSAVTEGKRMSARISTRRGTRRTSLPPRSSTRRSGPTPLPIPEVGAKFFRYFEDPDCCFHGVVLGKEQANSSKKKEIWKVRYEAAPELSSAFSTVFGRGNGTEKMDWATLQMYLASGGSEQEAKDACTAGICQVCLRGHKLDEMLLCDSCNFGFHIECTSPPLKRVPGGDWYCRECLDAAASARSGALAGMGPLDRAGPGLSAAATPEMATFGFGESRTFTMDSFRRMATAFESRHLAGLPAAGPERAVAVEEKYWSLLGRSGEKAILTYGPDEIKVRYGSDLDTHALGSGFPTRRSARRLKQRIERLATELAAAKKQRPVAKQRCAEIGQEKRALEGRLKEQERYAGDGWNLNNLPRLEGSLLQHVEGGITGIIVPWLYMGMAFSSFCWHTEDHYFASINYVHFGAPKAWYGVPGAGADAFEAAVREMAPELFEVRPDVLTNIVTQFNPKELSNRGVPVFRTTQGPGEFVVTFPRAYHGGFNMGFNCAEAVNFATPEWVPFGAACLRRYGALHKVPIIAHEALVLKLAALCATEQETVQLAQYLVPHMQDLLHRERERRVRVLEAWDTKLRRVSPGEFERTHRDDGVKEEAGEQEVVADEGGENSVAFGNSKMVRKSNVAGTNIANSFGRQRGREKGELKNMRMQRMKQMQRMNCLGGDASSAASAHLQRCVVCQAYCPLSFVYIQEHSSDGQVWSRTCYCLDHVTEAFSESGESPVSLVVVQDLDEVQQLQERVTVRAMSKKRWEERLHRLLQGSLQPDDALGAPQGTIHAPAFLDQMDWSEGGSEDEGSPASDWDESDKQHLENVLPWQKQLESPDIQVIRKLAQQVDGEEEEEPYKFLTKSTVRPDMAQFRRLLLLAGKVPIKERQLVELRAILEQGNQLVRRIQMELPNSYKTRRKTVAPDRKRKRNPSVLQSMNGDEVDGMTSVQRLTSLLDEVNRSPLDIARTIVRPVAKLLRKAKRWQGTYGVPLLHQAHSCFNFEGNPDSGSALVLPKCLGVRPGKSPKDCLELCKEACKSMESEVLVETPEYRELKLLSRFAAWYQGVAEQFDLLRDPDAKLSLEAVQGLLKSADAAGVHLEDENRSRLQGLLDTCTKWSEAVDTALGKEILDPDELESLQSQGDKLPCECDSQELNRALHRFESLRTRVRKLPQQPTVLAITRVLDASAKFKLDTNGDFARLFQTARDTSAWCADVASAFKLAAPCGAEPNQASIWAKDLEATLKQDLKTRSTLMNSSQQVLRTPETTVFSNESLFCFCRKPEVEGELMLQCDKCDDWYHPACIGLDTTETQAVEAEVFLCPLCDEGADSLEVFCVCKKPYMDLTNMLQCCKCAQWVHPQCVGVSDKTVASFERDAGLPYCCPACCRRVDVPALALSGEQGFEAARKVLSKLRRALAPVKKSAKAQSSAADALDALGLRLQGDLPLGFRPAVAEARRLVRRCPVEDHPVLAVLRSALQQAEELAGAARAGGCPSSTSCGLWNYLLAEVCAMLKADPELVTATEVTLLGRFVASLHAEAGGATGEATGRKATGSSETKRAWKAMRKAPLHPLTHTTVAHAVEAACPTGTLTSDVREWAGTWFFRHEWEFAVSRLLAKERKGKIGLDVLKVEAEELLSAVREDSGEWIKESAREGLERIISRVDGINK